MCKNTVSANLYLNYKFISKIINLRYQQTILYKYRSETNLRKKLAHKHLLNFQFNTKNPKVKYII